MLIELLQFNMIVQLNYQPFPYTLFQSSGYLHVIKQTESVIELPTVQINRTFYLISTVYINAVSMVTEQTTYYNLLLERNTLHAISSILRTVLYKQDYSFTEL